MGVRLRPQPTPDGVLATVIVPGHFQGFRGIVHGGIVTGLMDDAMWWAVFAVHGAVTLTAELTTRYRHPVPVSTALEVCAMVAPGRNRRLFACTAHISHPGGQVLAEAAGKFLVAPPELAAALRRDFTE